MSVRPGITGVSSIAYLEEEQILGQGDPEMKYLTSVMPAKLALELQYVRTASFGGDMKILGRTLWRLFRRPRRGLSPEA